MALDRATVLSSYSAKSPLAQISISSGLKSLHISAVFINSRMANILLVIQYISVFLLTIFLGRALMIFLHEMGHGIMAAAFTEGKISLYLGTQDKTKKILYIITVLTFLTSCKKELAQEIPVPATATDTVKDAAGAEKWEKYEAWQDTKDYRDFELDTMVLERLQTSRDEKLVASFAKANDTLKKFPGDSIPKMLYTIDINGDNRKDIIFHGSSGSEAFITHIYLQGPKGFRAVFSGYQHMSEPVFKNGRLASFVLLNPGCCADTSIEEHHYTVSWDTGAPVFLNKQSFFYVERMQKADRLFGAPKSFSITAARTVTRMDCYLLDFIEDGPGNETGWFGKGDKGKALGWKHEDGREWLYVLMDPSNKTNKALKDERPFYMYGWILKSETDLR